MYQIDDAGKCFEFLSLIYEDGFLPKFNQVELSEIDKGLFSEKGSEETVFIGGSKQLNYSKYYAVIGKPYCKEFTIAFDYDRTVLMENDELLFKKDVLTIREQLSQSDIKESDVLFIVLDERCENRRKNSCVLRALTIFSAKGVEKSLNYDACLYNIDLELNHLEEQIIEINNLKMAFEANGKI